MSGKLPEFWVSKTRLETLLDGVFAIAMTLMVLELKVPELHERRSMSELTGQIAHNGPAAFGFILSVFVLGIFWYKHHQQFHLIHRIDRGLLAINLAFLTGVAFFPFAAGIIGKFAGNPAVFFVYFPSLAFLAICLMAQWTYARRRGLLDPSLDADAARSLDRRNLAFALAVTVLSGLYIGAAVLAERLDRGRDWVGLIPLAMIPFALYMKRLRNRQGSTRGAEPSGVTTERS
jgi:uncharacterized membrane protein